MTLSRLLESLGGLGVELRADGADLLHRPAELPPGLGAALTHHRRALLDLLGRGADPLPGADDEARYVLGERLGMADGLGLATHPGSAAWLVAVGESMGV